MVSFDYFHFIFSFEIKCLSKKYPLYVNGVAYHLADEAVPLHSRSIISISSESFFFLLPPSTETPIIPSTAQAAVQLEEVKV